MKVGKKTREWERIRAKIKKEFARRGITYCELRYKGCWLQIQGFAHKKKRRYLTEAELYEVIGVCNSCHDRIEYLPAEEMLEIVERVIRGREVFI